MRTAIVSVDNTITITIFEWKYMDYELAHTCVARLIADHIRDAIVSCCRESMDDSLLDRLRSIREIPVGFIWRSSAGDRRIEYDSLSSKWCQITDSNR